ncbi:hypothetical protein POTOM_004964 [Populus tomentosa]|uniref:Uncharacterized protein n=1 Tax=Populus tomentosa TaxID=118781 RepID=A0A8X8D655_POPTO|nr:hypothetical protein POTOM_004964 [Populus tomentosa]
MHVGTASFLLIMAYFDISELFQAHKFVENNVAIIKWSNAFPQMLSRDMYGHFYIILNLILSDLYSEQSESLEREQLLSLATSLKPEISISSQTIYRRAERWNNPSQEQQDTLESHNDSIKAEIPNQFSSTWEELADIGHLTPPSHCLSGAVASSGSLNIRDCSKKFLGQSQQESSVLSPSGYLNWHHSPSSLTSKLYGCEALPELSSDSFFCNMMMEDATPETLKNTCTPSTEGVKSCSPNQKWVSPPKIRSHELRSSWSQGLRSGCKFILQDLPSFPPLTSYSKSQATIHQNDGDHKGSTGYQ